MMGLPVKLLRKGLGLTSCACAANAKQRRMKRATLLENFDAPRTAALIPRGRRLANTTGLLTLALLSLGVRL